MRRLIAVAVFAATVTTLVVLATGSADRPQSRPSAKQVVGYLNHQRELRGLVRLTSRRRLASASRAWSLRLERTGAFEHAPLTPGATFSWVAETLYRGPGGPVTAWLSSVPHRQIVLSPRARLVGVARWGDTWTARFAAP